TETRGSPASSARSKAGKKTRSTLTFNKRAPCPLCRPSRARLDTSQAIVVLHFTPCGSLLLDLTEAGPMNPFLHGVVRAVTETFDLPAPVVEIGALQIEGQEPIGNLRPLFPGKTYHGLDCRTGPGVDIIGNVESLPL